MAEKVIFELRVLESDDGEFRVEMKGDQERMRGFGFKRGMPFGRFGGEHWRRHHHMHGPWSEHFEDDAREWARRGARHFRDWMRDFARAWDDEDEAKDGPKPEPPPVTNF